MSDNQPVYKRKKFAWIVVASTIVGAIVGSGIVRHSAKWVAEGGSYALLGLFLVWIAYFAVSLAMVDNVSIMPGKGGVYGWTRKTMGRFKGNQIGWIYLVGFTCLSVILSWLAYIYTLDAIRYFAPDEGARLGAVIFSIIIPMIFIAVFTFSFTLGVKRTTQVIVGFFTIKLTMWLTILGVGLLHFKPGEAVNLSDTSVDPFGAILGVGALTLFAMNGLDAVSVISDDIHKPKKNFAKGVIIGMIIVLILYGSTIITIMGLVGQEGAGAEGGISEIFLSSLSVPPPVLLVFIVISIIGTLYINMYMVIRMSGAMAENNDFFYGNHARKHLEESQDLTGLYRNEIPLSGIIISTLLYGVFFILIFVENLIDSETGFVIYVVDNLALFPFLVILFFIAWTNFKARRMGLANDKEKGYKWAKGYIIPIFGMLSIVFIMGYTVYQNWYKVLTQQWITDLPASLDVSKAFVFWQYFGIIFPVFMVVPGLLFWLIWGKRKSLPDASYEKYKAEKAQKEGKEPKEKKVKEAKPKKEKKVKEKEPKEEPKDAPKEE